jgi:hypothetical protein
MYMGSCSIGEIDVSHGANGSATPLDRCRSSEPSPGARDPHSLAARDVMLRWARWSWLCVVAGGGGVGVGRVGGGVLHCVVQAMPQLRDRQTGGESPTQQCSSGRDGVRMPHPHGQRAVQPRHQPQPHGLASNRSPSRSSVEVGFYFLHIDLNCYFLLYYSL